MVKKGPRTATGRRLAAIMFTDMIGFTTLGQTKESFSLALLKEHRKLLRPIFKRHNGIEIKTMGDAFLVKFDSALEAARCAYDVQRTIREFNFSLPEEKRIGLRVGLHVGDVVVSRRDISGDAVNVASRIEPLAKNGGVCLTRQIYDQIESKIDLGFQSMGFKSFKNVKGQIEIFNMVLPWEKTELQDSLQVDRSRVAVLPFSNMSPDPSDEYFADGMTEELISTLSKISGLKVIARTSVMAYKTEGKKISEIAKELQVGTILEGSVRKAGNNLRITAQLIDGQTSDHLWSESYDREMKNVFAIQSEISMTVVDALKVRLLSAEKDRIQKKPTESVEAYELYLKGLETAPWIKSYEKDDMERSREYFERAVEIDPKFALAYAGLEACYMEAFDYKIFKERFPKAESAARKALEIDPNLAEARLAYADVLAHSYDLPGFEREATRAIELKPSSAQAHFYLGIYEMILGRFQSAESELQMARELDPLSSVVREWYGSMLIRSRQYERALEYYSGRLKQQESPELHYNLALAHYYKGDFRKAQEEVEIALAQGSAKDKPAFECTLARIYAKSGKMTEALELLEKLEDASQRGKLSVTTLAGLYAACGKNDMALQILEKAYEEHNDMLPWVLTGRQYDDLHSDPKFVDLLNRLALGRAI